MATCRICGTEDNSLPDWQNWDCFECFIEQLYDNGNRNHEILVQQLDSMRAARSQLNGMIISREMELALHEQRRSIDN